MTLQQIQALTDDEIRVKVADMIGWKPCHKGCETLLAVMRGGSDGIFKQHTGETYEIRSGVTLLHHVAKESTI